MSITIFTGKGFTGLSQTVTGDIRDLRGQLTDKPGSIRLTDPSDSVLLFKNDDWHEGALFIRGEKWVSDLGSAKEGGRALFGNSVRSIRVTPFKLRLNVSVLKDGGNLPGDWPNDRLAHRAVRDVVSKANAFYLTQRALLELEIARVTFRDDPAHFNLSGVESWKFPGDWKQKGAADVIFVNRFEKDGTTGRTKNLCFGETVAVCATANLKGWPDDVMTTGDMAVTLVHELGHHLGLGHGTADKDTYNIMFRRGRLGNSLSDFELDDDQIREMHDRLANHHTRRGERIS